MNVWDILFGDERYLFLWRGLEVTILLTVFSTIIGLMMAWLSLSCSSLLGNHFAHANYITSSAGDHA